MGILITVPQVRTFVGITDPAIISDADIEFYIKSAEAQIFNELDTTFESTRIIDIYDGDDTDTLVLDKYPLISVLRVNIDGQEIPPEKYWVYKEKNLIRLKDLRFPAGYQNIVIEYEYGIPKFEDPTTFQLASTLCLYLAARPILTRFKPEEHIKTEKIGEYSLSYDYNRKITTIDHLIDELWASLGKYHNVKIF